MQVNELFIETVLEENLRQNLELWTSPGVGGRENEDLVLHGDRVSVLQTPSILEIVCTQKW